MCNQTTLDVSKSLSCTLSLTYTCGVSVAVDVDYGDDTHLYFTNPASVKTVSANSYGPVVPKSLTPSAQTALSYTYYVLNSEFLEDNYLTAIEFYSTSNGTTVIFKVSEVNSPKFMPEISARFKLAI